MTVVASNYARKENDLTASRARDLFDFDILTGALIWREREFGEFPDLRIAASWNAKNAGREAGWIGSDGYRRVTIGDRSYLAHRVIWLINYGSWPANEIDHLDQCRTNNRLSNLREATTAQNAKNRTLPSNNRSGHIGVRQADSGRWRAEIKVLGKKHFLGTFDNKDAAIAARKSAEISHGFSQNHGRSA